MSYMYNNPFPQGSLSEAELQSNPLVLKYIIKSPAQSNNATSDGTNAQKFRKHSPIIIGLWLLLGACITLVLINSQTNIYKNHEKRKI